VAEELAQETFARAWRSWQRVQSDGAVAYLRATVVNLARSSLRRRLIELKHRREAPTAVAGAEGADERVDLARAIAQLPPRRRACVVLRYYADLSEEETARLLGVSVGAVKSQTHRALQSLSALLSQDEALDRGRGER
jgi:RNA polymerase sigma-70 factor (sigma-E family)